MERHNAIRWRGATAAILIITWVLLTPAYCQTLNVTLLIQQSPAQGGIISPSPGIYDFAPNSEVTLTAIPKPGYQFVYWLGDVADPTASITITYLNKPKIIIAVFQQTEYDVLLTEASVSGSNRSSTYAGGGGGISTPVVPPAPPIPPEPPEPPIPEPATGLLLTLGSLVVLRKRTA
jgi:hypothetical protein